VSAYVAILGMVALATVFVVVAVGLSVKIGPRRRNLTKEDSYECGVDPTPAPKGGGRFSVKYYITAMLFIIFDIEIVFLYPWAVTFDRLGLFAVAAMVMFILTVFVAYFYVLRRGGLEWD